MQRIMRLGTLPDAALGAIRRARDRQRCLGSRCRGRRRSRRSERRARDQGLDPGEQLRPRRRAGSRPPSATTTRRSCTPRTSCARRTRPRTRASSRPSSVTRRARSTGSRSSAARSRARTAATASRAAAARRASGCSRSATAPATRSRRRSARPTRPAAPRASRTTRSPRSSRPASGWRASFTVKDGDLATIDAGTVVLAAGGRCYAEAARRHELSTNHPNATGEVTQIALELGAEARDLDALQYHPNGGAWPVDDAGLLDPRDDARLRRRAPQRRRRGVHRLARPARRRLAGDLRRGRGRPRRRDRGRPPGRLPRHDPDPGGRRGRLAAVHAAALPRRRHRSAHRAAPHLPCPPLPERRSRDRRARRDHARGAVRLRRDRRRHPRAQPHDGQLAARVRRLRTTRRTGSLGESERYEHDHHHRPRRSRRGRGSASVRLGAEGHPAGPPRRARGGARPRDLEDRHPDPRDDPPQRLDRRRAEEPRLPGHRDRRLHLPRRRALPAPPGAHLRGAEGGHGARDDRASAALERGARADAREHRPEHRLPPADRPLGVHPGLGRPRRQVRARRAPAPRT